MGDFSANETKKGGGKGGKERRKEGGVLRVALFFLMIFCKKPWGKGDGLAQALLVSAADAVAVLRLVDAWVVPAVRGDIPTAVIMAALPKVVGRRCRRC